MNITKADLEARIAELNKLRNDVIANANAINGAIEDCQFWLERLGKEEEVKEPRLVSKE
jgi:hypothetical protein